MTDAPEQDNTIAVKLLLVGPSKSGKTSFCSKYCDDSFNPTYVRTVGIDFRSKFIENNGDTLKLQMWDTAGDPRYASIAKSYYENAKCFILIFDANSEESFDAIPSIFEDCKTASADAAFILAGNQSDLLEEEPVATDKAKKFAADNGMDYMLTSCKSGKNIEEVVLKLVEKIPREEPKSKEPEEPEPKPKEPEETEPKPKEPEEPEPKPKEPVPKLQEPEPKPKEPEPKVPLPQKPDSCSCEGGVMEMVQRWKLPLIVLAASVTIYFANKIYFN